MSGGFHGAVRADGSGRDRRGLRGGQVVRRAVVRRTALAAQPDPGAHGGGRPPRSQDRPWVLRVRRRPVPAPRSSATDAVAAATAPRSPCSARVRSPPHCASGPQRRVRPAGMVSRPDRRRPHLPADSPPGGAPLPRCASSSLAGRCEFGAVGFHLLPFGDLVELTPPARRSGSPSTPPRRFSPGSASPASGWTTPPVSCRTYRLPARQRSLVRGRRGRGLPGRRRHRAHARPQPPRGPIAGEAIGLDHVMAVDGFGPSAGRRRPVRATPGARNFARPQS